MIVPIWHAGTCVSILSKNETQIVTLNRWWMPGELEVMHQCSNDADERLDTLRRHFNERIRDAWLKNPTAARWKASSMPGFGGMLSEHYRFCSLMGLGHGITRVVLQIAIEESTAIVYSKHEPWSTIFEVG